MRQAAGDTADPQERGPHNQPTTLNYVCLDSWALLSWLDGENPAVGIVREVIDDRPVMSWINLAEVYYRLERDHGSGRAVTAKDLPCELRDLRG